MTKKIKIVIYIIVVIFSVFLIAKAIKQESGANPEILDKVVILDEAKVLPENEGKLVLVSGKLKASERIYFKQYVPKITEYSASTDCRL